MNLKVEKLTTNDCHLPNKCVLLYALCFCPRTVLFTDICVPQKAILIPGPMGAWKLAFFSFFLPVVIVEEAEKSWILNALLKYFILLFCIITHSSSSFKNMIIVPWKLLAIAWRGVVVLFHSVYFPKSFYVSVNYLFSWMWRTVVTITFGTATHFTKEQPP